MAFLQQEKKAAKIEKTNSVKKEDKFGQGRQVAPRKAAACSGSLPDEEGRTAGWPSRPVQGQRSLANRDFEISQNSTAGQMLNDPFMIRFSADTSNVYLHKVNHWARGAERSHRKIVPPQCRTPSPVPSRSRLLCNDTLLIDDLVLSCVERQLITPIRQEPGGSGRDQCDVRCRRVEAQGGQGSKKNPEITSILNYSSEPDGYTVTVRRRSSNCPRADGCPLAGQPRGLLFLQLRNMPHSATSSKDKLLTHDDPPLAHRAERGRINGSSYYRGELVEPERK